MKDLFCCWQDRKDRSSLGPTAVADVWWGVGSPTPPITGWNECAVELGAGPGPQSPGDKVPSGRARARLLQPAAASEEASWPLR